MVNHPTKVYHKSPSSVVLPSRPELSQVGKTILVTGWHTGIGYAIAHAFVTASAARVIIIGRRQDVIDSSASQLVEAADHLGSKTSVLGMACDIADLDSTRSLWSSLSDSNIAVDVLVLSAATLGTTEPVLSRGLDQVWGDYVTNVRSALDFAEVFYKQSLCARGTQKFLLNVSSAAIHTWQGRAGARTTYGLTKNSATLLFRQIAKDTSPQDMQIISFHPGTILSEAARGQGFSENSNVPWDDITLPASFAVWAASGEAEFLHGRFVWANWDMDELRSQVVGMRVAEVDDFLRIGVNGI